MKMNRDFVLLDKLCRFQHLFYSRFAVILIFLGMSISISAPEADFRSKESSEKVEIEPEHLEPGKDMLAVLQFNINGLNARKEELLKTVKTKTLSFIGIQELRMESEKKESQEGYFKKKRSFTQVTHPKSFWTSLDSIQQKKPFDNEH
jgi:hypothetical protein